MPSYPAQPSPIGGSAQKETVERIRAGQDMLGVRRPARSLAPLPAGGIHTATDLKSGAVRGEEASSWGAKRGTLCVCVLGGGGSELWNGEAVRRPHSSPDSAM
jgi:hypothetical protein